MKHPEPKTATMARTCGVLVAILAASTCRAHPGHGEAGGDWSLHHYLTEPEHLVALLGLVLLAVGFLYLLNIFARGTHGATKQAIRRPDDLPASAKRTR